MTEEQKPQSTPADGSSYGAALPLPTLIVIAISDFLTRYWWMMAARSSSVAAS